MPDDRVSGSSTAQLGQPFSLTYRLSGPSERTSRRKEQATGHRQEPPRRALSPVCLRSIYGPTPNPALEGTGEVRLRAPVDESLRMRPSRLVVGEVRAEECFDLLPALNAGLLGMASLYANSAREALVKMCPCRCWPERTSGREVWSLASQLAVQVSSLHEKVRAMSCSSELSDTTAD